MYVPGGILCLLRLHQSVPIIEKNYGYKRLPQHVQVTSVAIELGAPQDLMVNGLRVVLCGVKPEDFCVDNIRLSVEGEEFWQDMSRIAGAHIVALIQWSGLYPLILAPSFFDPTTVKKGSPEVKAIFTFATDACKYKAKGATFLKLIRGLAKKSTARIELLFEFGQNGWTGFKAKGVMCRISFSPQQLLEAVDNSGRGHIAFDSDDMIVTRPCKPKSE